MLLIGMAFWVLRYVLFAHAGPDAHILLYLGVLFHGICYDFFFVTGQLYVDKAAPDDVRSSAQGFIAFVTLGAGMFVGEYSTVGGIASNMSTVFLNWPSVWYFPAILSGNCFGHLSLSPFKEPQEEN